MSLNLWEEVMAILDCPVEAKVAMSGFVRN